MIEAKALRRVFGSHVALSDLTFRVEPGCVVGLLGRNGAGKTTCLRILAGVLRPTAGSVRICGFDGVEQADLARAQVGYLPESAPLYPELRVSEYLGFRAELKGLPRHRRRARISEVLSLVHADEVRDVPSGHLSRGYQKRIGLADALLGDPQVLLLDEPTAGLDPNQNRETRSLIATLGRSRSIIVSTHILSEVEAMCGRALLIERGHLVAQGTVSELQSMRGCTEICAEVRAEHQSELEARLSKLQRPCAVSPLGDTSFTLTFSVPQSEEAQSYAEQIAVELVGAGIALRSLTPKSANLEQVFADLTKGTEIA